MFIPDHPGPAYRQPTGAGGVLRDTAEMDSACATLAEAVVVKAVQAKRVGRRPAGTTPIQRFTEPFISKWLALRLEQLASAGPVPQRPKLPPEPISLPGLWLTLKPLAVMASAIA